MLGRTGPIMHASRMSARFDLFRNTPRVRDRIRTAIISVLLLVSLAMMGLLSQQTYLAVTSQRQLANDVLHDYAALAGDEFGRRYAQVAYSGFFPVLGSVAQVPLDTDLPAPEGLSDIVVESERDRERLSLSTGLARMLFRFDPDVGRLQVAGEALPNEASDFLLDHLLTATSSERTDVAFSAIHTQVDGEDYNFVHTSFSERSVVGFLVNLDTLGDWLDYFIERDPLLPRSLIDDETDVVVHGQLLDGSGRVFYEVGEAGRDMVTSSRPMGNRVPVLFGGITITAGLDRETASRLIIGGLPESRLPLVYGSTAAVLGAMWTVAALMMAMALVLLRRERQLAHLRADFISRVSHELRTPLAQIRMFAETLLLDRVRSEDERRRSLQVIDKEANRLSHLVENVLQFSRGERGRLELNMHAQPITPLVRELADRFRPLMRDRELVVTSEVDEAQQVDLDSEAFSQMFANLIDNAVKYSPAGEPVSVSVQGRPGHVLVAVEDSGPGIPVAERQRIWEPYYRAGAGDGLEIAGSGIGLAVVQELARLHNAEASVSESATGGARFVIDFGTAPELAA
mgnify:CR=1 FL=1